jgi:hypothetical protein
MLDIDLIRTHVSEVKGAAARRRIDGDIDQSVSEKPRARGR